MSLYLACDHRGVALKNQLLPILAKEYNVITSNVANDPDDDYPDFAFDVCTHMSKTNDIAILICGNGIGISIAANKVKGIRCARVINLDDAIQAREHNHANSLSIPADMDVEMAYQIIKLFITTKLSTIDRHVRRVNKITSYENGEYNEL